MFAPLIEESLETSLQGKNWRAQARCADMAGTLTALFFSEELQDIAQAKAICAECPVLAPCLAGALERPEPWGVWGGQPISNGKILAHKRRRGRPPKVPSPEDRFVAIPIPQELLEAGVA